MSAWVMLVVALPLSMIAGFLAGWIFIGRKLGRGRWGGSVLETYRTLRGRAPRGSE